MKTPIALVATLAIGTAFVTTPVTVNAQTVRHHHHHRLATIATGVGAYALAKHSHHGFFHRHPVLTGVGAGWLMHHHLKHKHKSP